jgi:hypothetical protein
MKINYTLLAGAAVAAALVYKFKDFKGFGAGVGGAVVDVVDGVIGGTVVGIGQAVGVPPTSQTECQRAMAEGRTWDASFACPAGDFLGYAFGGKQTQVTDPLRADDGMDFRYF